MTPAYPPGSCGLCHGTGILTCGNVQRSDEPKRPTMTQPTKPSAGAMRAAREWYVYPKDSRVESLAQIIDRETGMAELLEAAKNMYREQLAARWNKPDMGYFVSEKVTNALRLAIAKCERKE